MSHVLIAGNGPAAHRLVERLRGHGHDGPITVLGAEDRPAYNRVLLASVLDGTLPPDAVELPELDADVRTGVTATAVDPARRLVRADTGVVHRYDELVLATGARAAVPAVPGLRAAGGALAAGVAVLRTLADCARIPAGARRAVVLGGGVLGVETARGLLGRGLEVVLVHPQPHPMDRQLDAAGGALLAEHLREAGVRTRFGRRAAAHRPGELVLDDGEVLAADVVVLCTGVVPETGLAREAGLAVGRGVLVDDHLATSDPRVHALGDCAEHDERVPGLIAPAWEQAEVLARRLAGGSARYRVGGTVTRLKARGIDVASLGEVAELASPAAEPVVLSDPARGRYAKLAVRGERLTGAVLIGFPQATATLAQLHDRDLPLPVDRLGLLLGAAPTAAPAEPTADAVLCRCNDVSKRRLEDAWRAGARDLGALARTTRATTGCGGCADEVRGLCAALRAAEPAGADEPEQEGAA
ncbi:FAD-dependent oxidoreductase [Saccharopolyspora sp. NPDC047091]|uniref:FAD-dependent oxidoreductase n=1 Tax=Saccharopolyspora sp. NPDC047091 TaxID=3155924 RepID=UPI0033C52F03